MSRIVIAGGSGHLGRLLAGALTARGMVVVVLSRRAGAGVGRTVVWDGESGGAWEREIDGAAAVINLAGRSVNCRYTAANRREILESRVRSTRALGRAIERAERPPAVWLQSSTATIYGHRYDAGQDEATGVIGGGAPGWEFSIDVARAWEEACLTSGGGVRRVLLRSAMVLGSGEGGPFTVLRRLARWGLGGAAGDGRQYFSWIHEADFVGAVEWLLAHGEMAGPVNLAAPGPLPNAEFMRVLRRACGAWIGLPASGWMLRAGAWVMGTETELVLKSRRVVPGRLLAAGFRFRFPEWEGAARELCGRVGG